MPKHLLLGIDQPVQNFPFTIKPKLSFILNNRFRKAGLCARKWPDCIFLHLLIQSFWVNVTCQAKISVKKTLLFEAEIYVPGYAQNAGFCTIYPRASGGLQWPPDPWSSGPPRKRGGQARFAALIGQPNTFLD